MKLDFIIAHLRSGGAQRVMVLLANHFSKLGYQVNIITFNKGLAFDLDEKINLVNLHHGKIPNHTFRSLYNLILYYKKKKNRPNLVISFITQLNFISILASKFYGIKIIVSEHSNYLSAQKPVFFTHFIRKYLYIKADYLTVLTSYDVDFYKKMGINVTIMPNPLTFEVIKELPANRTRTILAIGNVERYHIKGFDNLLEIAAPLLKKYPDWKLKIVGGGDSGLQFLKEKAKDYAIEDYVVFPGFRNDIAKIMNDSEIFILTSRHEGLPMVLLEAMSQGMACISYDCITGPSDIITHDYNGILVDNQNIPEMRANLEMLMNDNALRDKLKNNGPKSLDRFKIETIASKWIQLFENLN
ncbi:glycosyltransferase family 4 protein [Flagellimonas marinaquae]|uniref:glycosyltransferase family 4 protein n=1 Tax=Flagellimonas marinaquae TaxID=254955 RepID=UPI00207630E5|nr:glycosyltransferase family 4 protein [Allomuricauda aquimarina]USD24821.1 glycosyltransferase family 4 protein [Allomuricauda aquimarina]